eukprot:Em0007g182a
MQALFNALAMLFLLVGACIAAAVYYVLKPFLHALLWAILTGTFLHPFKHRCTTQLNAWLLRLEESKVPLTFGLLLSPLYLFNWVSTSLMELVLTHWVALAGSVFGLCGLWALVALSASAYDGFEVTYGAITHLDVVLAQTRWLQFYTLVAGLVILLFTVRRRVIWRVFFLSLWVCLAVNLGSYLLGPVIIPIVAVAMALGGGAALYHHILCEAGEEDTLLPRTSSIPSSHAAAATDGIAGRTAKSGSGMEHPELHVVLHPEQDGREKEEEEGVEVIGGQAGSKEAHSAALATLPEERGRVSPQTHHGSDADDMDFGRVHRMVPHVENHHHHGNLIFVALLSVCTVVVFWLHPFLFYTLIPPCVWLVVRYVCSRVVWSKGVAFFASVASTFGTWVDVVMPIPLSSLTTLFVSLDRLCAYVVKTSLGSLVSVHIILGLVLVVAGGVLLLGFETQVELRHFGSVVMSIWNSTMAAHPHLSQWSDHTNATLQASLGPFFVEGYEYGRTWLVSKIQLFVSDHLDNSSVLGEGLLHLYDTFYHSYVLQNTTSSDGAHVANDDRALYDNRLLLWSELQTIVQSNWETVMTLWSLVSNNVALIANNLALVASFLTSLLSVLLSGGTALLNMFVFFTALYYVLSLSEESYLPTSWVMDFLPLSYTGGDLGEVLSRSIRSVFHASLQRAFFYGLYTWVVHAIFDLPVSVLPAVLAAIVGAVPFVGPYWAALPAVLELWLVEKQLVLALCLLGLLLLPYFLLDNILYEEVEGAHPYLTGLAVAGGIYFAGLEGAIIGPILLCCLLFVKELYNNLCDQIEQGDALLQPHGAQTAHSGNDYLY